MRRAISKDENKTESSNAVKNLSGSLNNLLSAVDKEFAKSGEIYFRCMINCIALNSGDKFMTMNFNMKYFGYKKIDCVFIWPLTLYMN